MWSSDGPLVPGETITMSKGECKVFVGGLSWETTDERLRGYFEHYGAVQEAFVSFDRHTGRPRGFGFVVFEDPAVAERVVSLPHTVDRREVQAKKAVPRDDYPKSRPVKGAAQQQRTRKVFVGGLAPSVDQAAFRHYFEQFGPVEDAVVMYDHDSKRPRGFGFVTFLSEDSVDNVFQQGSMQSLHEKKIEIKRAVPRDQMPPTRGRPGYGRGGRQGRGLGFVAQGLADGGYGGMGGASLLYNEQLRGVDGLSPGFNPDILQPMLNNLDPVRDVPAAAAPSIPAGQSSSHSLLGGGLLRYPENGGLPHTSSIIGSQQPSALSSSDVNNYVHPEQRAGSDPSVSDSRFAGMGYRAEEHSSARMQNGTSGVSSGFWGGSNGSVPFQQSIFSLMNQEMGDAAGGPDVLGLSALGSALPELVPASTPASEGLPYSAATASWG